MASKALDKNLSSLPLGGDNKESDKNHNTPDGVDGENKESDKDPNNPSKGENKESNKKKKNQPKADDSNKPDDRPNDYDDIPKGPWGDRAVTSPKAGTKKPPAKDSSLNIRINLDLRADVALELHAVIQGDVTIGLF